jgi:arsenical pump membrane protein
MLVPTLFALAASAIVLFGYFRKQIPLTYEHHLLQPAQAAIKDTRLFKMSWYLLALLLAAYFVSSIFHLPVSVFAVVATIIFLLAARNSKAIPTKRILKSAPWKIVVFSIGMYVVVYGLQNVGLTAELGDFVQRMADKGMFVATMGMGFLAAILSSVMNNMPTVMIDALAIKSVHTSQQVHEALVYANVVGSDLGPKITPIGSLATLLWLHVLSQKGIKITWGYYFKVGVLLTIPVLAVTSFGLYVWLTIIQ